jgi:hypothetical protein
MEGARQEQMRVAKNNKLENAMARDLYAWGPSPRKSVCRRRSRGWMCPNAVSAWDRIGNAHTRMHPVTGMQCLQAEQGGDPWSAGLQQIRMCCVYASMRLGRVGGRRDAPLSPWRARPRLAARGLGVRTCKLSHLVFFPPKFSRTFELLVGTLAAQICKLGRHA